MCNYVAYLSIWVLYISGTCTSLSTYKFGHVCLSDVWYRVRHLTTVFLWHVVVCHMSNKYMR